jgi:2-C-methyl-D-erythritol 2,4-cyclodiphosphate synthase
VRVGVGFDAHGFTDARPLVLGGATIPGARGLAGYSDADVLSHAVADALLGAAGLGDLGSRFPGTAEWRDASSLGILARTSELLASDGWEVANVDATVVAEQPPLAPFRAEMIANIAGALNVDPAAVSVKATTTDGLGFTGRAEGVAAHAVVLISKVKS